MDSVFDNWFNVSYNERYNYGRYRAISDTVLLAQKSNNLLKQDISYSLWNYFAKLLTVNVFDNFDIVHHEWCIL